MDDVRKFQEKISKFSYWRQRVFSVTWLVYVGFYLTRKSFVVAKISIQDDPNVQISEHSFDFTMHYNRHHESTYVIVNVTH